MRGRGRLWRSAGLARGGMAAGGATVRRVTKPDIAGGMMAGVVKAEGETARAVSARRLTYHGDAVQPGTIGASDPVAAQPLTRAALRQPPFRFSAPPLLSTILALCVAGMATAQTAAPTAAPLPRPTVAATGQGTDAPLLSPPPVPRPVPALATEPATAQAAPPAPPVGGPVPPVSAPPVSPPVSAPAPVVPGVVHPTPSLRLAPQDRATGIATALRQAVLTVDQEAMYRQSLWGQRAAVELARQSQKVSDDNDTAFAALVADEDALTAARPTLSADEFRRRAAAFDERVTAVRRERDTAREALQAGADRERALFFQNAAPVMGGVMAARGALVVLDQRTVLISDQSIDATAAVIAALDAELGDGSGIVAGADAVSGASSGGATAGGAGAEAPASDAAPTGDTPTASTLGTSTAPTGMSSADAADLTPVTRSGEAAAVSSNDTPTAPASSTSTASPGDSSAAPTGVNPAARTGETPAVPTDRPLTAPTGDTGTAPSADTPRSPAPDPALTGAAPATQTEPPPPTGSTP